MQDWRQKDYIIVNLQNSAVAAVEHAHYVGFALANCAIVEEPVSISMRYDIFHYCIASPEPVNNLQVSTLAATTLTITWTASGSIDRFEVRYSYTVNRCSAPRSAPRTDTISDVSMRSYILRDLNEDSSYTITVRLINAAGSTMATVFVDTLTSGIQIN